MTVEHTLGEGEFGRVLRAQALDIAGTNGFTSFEIVNVLVCLVGHGGYTVVAVKTLKDGASALELSDLLSEYELLKQVSHPNVIKLLGACTVPQGAPVYLIIEFCEEGCLRNYLKRNRLAFLSNKVNKVGYWFWRRTTQLFFF